MKRLFVAIELPAVERENLAALDPHVRGVQFVRPDKMHLTLSFFGNTGDEAEIALKDRLARIEFKRFFLPLNGVGVFPTKGRPSVVWVGVGTGHPHLFQLHKRIQEAALGAGIEPDLRSFHPHITIARCRNVSPELVRPFLKKHEQFDAGMVPVSEFVLLSSELTPAGSIYSRELVVAAQAP